MFGGLPNEWLYTAYRIESVFLLRDGRPRSKTGTCFFVQNRRGELCLITNRHLLDFGYPEPAAEAVGSLLSALKVSGFVKDPTNQAAMPTRRREYVVEYQASAPRFSSIYQEDVAAIVDMSVRTTAEEEPPLVDYFFPHQLVATGSWISSVYQYAILSPTQGFLRGTIGSTIAPYFEQAPSQAIPGRTTPTNQ